MCGVVVVGFGVVVVYLCNVFLCVFVLYCVVDEIVFVVKEVYLVVGG